MVDLSGAQGGVSFGAGGGGGGHSADASAVSTWGGGVEVHRKAPIPRSAFVQQLVQHAALLEAEGAASWLCFWAIPLFLFLSLRIRMRSGRKIRRSVDG